MKITVSSAMIRLFNASDCVKIASGTCLSNESFQFQLFLETDTDVKADVRVKADVETYIYEVKKMKGDLYLKKETDDYYVYAKDDMYPELLKTCDTVEIKAGETSTLYVEVTAEKKSAGVHNITVTVGDESVCLPLNVLKTELVNTDFIVSHWMHMDGICHYYGLEPFSEAFYARFKQYLASYVKMGNNMILVPVFTPPLDTGVGLERLTTQLVKVKKVNDDYVFDFSQVEYYVDLCAEYGIKYFEFSHLFTQWGGEFCPKIMVEVDGEEKRLFGWDVSSESEEYKKFLKGYLEEFVAFVERKGIKDCSVMHLTDEPHAEHIETYSRLATFVKQHNGGVKIMDALSNFSFAERGFVDYPVVCTGSYELNLFDGRDRLLYYCVGVDNNYLSNRYFHLPLQRTQVLGFQLYDTGALGFMHWGYNFYNTRFSIRTLNPYEETTAGNEFTAGDSFVVYPGEKDVEYSIRFFALTKAFEDYRLLKTVEGKLGREKVLELLHNEGLKGVYEYPRSVQWHETFRAKLYSLL